MTVFDWEEKTLISTRDFQPDEDGFEDFEYLLANSVTMPARLLVDMIEEDFRRETIPHVNLWDRKALIDRQIDRHYRDETYVHASVYGRSKIGRRDDLLLLSALTNTGLLAPWLERLEKHNVRLAGIWSLPLLTDRLLKPVLADAEHALIVSRQVRSSLRNSYFHHGKLLLSRQAKFDKDMWDNDDFKGVIANLERGTGEIYNFLLNQRIMEGADELKVYCILNDDSLEEAQALTHDKSNIHYSFVSLQGLFKHFGVQNSAALGADALFSFLCTRTNSIYDHYATEDQKSTFYKYLVDKVITQVTEIGSLVCITIAVILALKSLELDQQQELLSLDIASLQSEYYSLYGDELNQLELSGSVQTAVTLLDKIGKDADQAPHHYFGPVGAVLSQPAFSNIQLQELEWQKYPALELQQIVIGHKLSLLEEEDPFLQEQLMAELYGDTGEDISSRRQSALTLIGHIKTEGASYRSTINKMQSFISELEQIPEVEQVLLIQTAVDVRDTARFTDQIGDDAESNAIGDDANSFEILIVMEPIDNA